MFPFVSFYAFSDIGTILYEKSHYRLSLSSFPTFSPRKDCRANLVSFMLVKVFEQSSSQYRFNLFRSSWNTNGKEVFLPQRFWGFSCAHFYPFSDSGDYIWKRDHNGVFFLSSDSVKMKTPSSVFFVGLAKNPRDRVIMVSFGATLYITV